MFDQTQIQEFKEAFNMIDQDKDGIITAQDLKLMFASLGETKLFFYFYLFFLYISFNNFVIHNKLKGKVETQATIDEMLKECTGPLNFTMFLSLFADKIGSTDPESVILNAYSMFDPEETGNFQLSIIKTTTN
jgi:Ca2+-binding EF-hand superfamily protein